MWVLIYRKESLDQMSALLKTREHKLLTICHNQWALGTREAAGELTQKAKLFPLENRGKGEKKEKKTTLIRSRLGVLEEYNGVCIIWKHRVHMGCYRPERSARGGAVGKGGCLYLPEQLRRITSRGKYWTCPISL